MSQMFKQNKFSISGVLLAAILVMAGPSFAKGLGTGITSQGGSTHSGHGGYVPSLPNEVMVSDHDFNQFIFPAPIVKGPIFPAGSPVIGRPVYLAGNTQILLQIAPGSAQPFDMIVECTGGTVYKLYLLPRPINGITYNVGNSMVGSQSVHFADNQPVSSAPRGAEVELLRDIVMNEIPSGFESIDLPPLTRFDEFTVVPLAGWSNGVLRVMTFSLVAVPDQTAVVAAPQFYRAGITAIMLSGNVVDATHSPTLYVVEKLNPDE